MTILARFSPVDEGEFQASYGRISQWAKGHDKSVIMNNVAPELSVLEDELTLVEEWLRRVREY